MESTNSSQELVQQALGKIEIIDHSGYELRSVLEVSATALDDAREYDNNKRDLPLGGVPILIKNNIEVKGLSVSAGSLALVNNRPQQDAQLVTRLRQAGAIILGSTNLSEWANIRSSQSTSGWSGVGGLTANPWIHKHSAGGSSSGSGAAVAANITQWAIGSETDGSIICPASLNGTVGIKPTVGSVPTHGVIPISKSQDSPGPMTQTVRQAAQLLEILTGTSQYISALTNPQDLVYGIVTNWKTSNDATNALLEEAISRLSKSGATLKEIVLPEPGTLEGTDEFHVLLHELYSDLGEFLSQRPGLGIASLADVVAFNRAHEDTEMQFFKQELFDDALKLKGRTAEYLAKRERNLAWATNALNVGFDTCDVLIGATYAPAWESTLGKGDQHGDASWITMAPAITGAPIGTVPMGLVNGLPVGIGIVSSRNQETKVLTAMAALERVLDIGVMQPTFVEG